MNWTEIIVTFLGAIVAFGGVYLKWRLDIKALMTKFESTVKNLEDKVTELAKDREERLEIVETMKTDIDNITKELETQKETTKKLVEYSDVMINAVDFLTKEDIKKKLKGELYTQSKRFVEDNKDLNSDFITLLHYGREACYELGKILVYREIEFNKDDIEREVNALLDDLRLKADKLIPSIGDIETRSFSIILREDTEIKELINVLIHRLVEIVKGTWNGSSNDRLVKYLSEFMTSAYREATKMWRELK